jgi:hypothetical protein
VLHFWAEEEFLKVTRPVQYIFALILAAAIALAGCRSEKGTVVPNVQINKKSAEMGTPVEVTYSFSTKKDYVALQKDLVVFVHFLDPKRNIRFQDDHNPPIKTSEWRPGGNYHYTRTVFIPKNIPAGEYKVTAGIYNPAGNGERLVLDAKADGNREYNMGNLLIEIPPTDPIIQYAKGWYEPENEPNNPAMHWRWTKKEAVLKVRNPMSNSLLYLKADSVPERFSEKQNVTVKVNDTVMETFPIASNQPFMKKYNVDTKMLGSDKMVDVKVEVDRVWRPADDQASPDTRELGIRIYEIYLGKAAD